MCKQTRLRVRAKDGKKEGFIPFPGEEFVVNSVKPTKLNANKLAAVFDVGVDPARKRRVCGRVCVSSAVEAATVMT